MIEVELLGSPAPSAERVRELCRLAAGAAGLRRGHLTVHFCDQPRIAELNGEFRGQEQPTDVLSFPIDGAEGQQAGEVPIELGDVFICPPCCEDLEAVVLHGVLHLAGMDHERDQGEMLALQDRLLAQARRERGDAPGASAPDAELGER